MVYSFEPTSIHAERLRKNIALNKLTNIEVIQFGLSDYNGKAKIFTQTEVCEDGTINRGLETLFPHEGRKNYVETIRLTTLDEFVAEKNIRALHIMKIDIEGAELSALKGSQKTLSRFKPIVFLEISRPACQAAGHEPEELWEFLDGKGYKVFSIMHSGQFKPLPKDDIQDYQNVICRAF